MSTTQQEPKLGALLVSEGLISDADVELALERQKENGGLLGEILVALGVITRSQLESVFQAAPLAPRNLTDIGIPLNQLLRLLVKAAHVANVRTPSQMRDCLKLPSHLVIKLIEEATSQNLLAAQGAAARDQFERSAELSYTLSERGQRLAAEALNQSHYVGPVPVPLRAYQDRIVAQKITNERISPEMIEGSLRDFVVPASFIEKIGPAINSGRSILLYGPPGNGKSSLAKRIGRVFKNSIYVPYCVDIDGQIMKVYDPSIHEEVDKDHTDADHGSIVQDKMDRRWVACRRPVVVVGGELNLSMLDLEFNSVSKFYDAPVHLKALGGTFIIDDFGRQFVQPKDLLNRWIVPLESRVDYMRLHSGKTFSIPFDELIIFATNLTPSDLMDPAFLRRIPYKIETLGPSLSDFRIIFERVSRERGLELPEEMLSFVVQELTESLGFDLAAYQPGFIADHVINGCKFKGSTPGYSKDEVRKALSHLQAA
jgi:energy-coupling factor transporter ATP-binding protein EcfA2